MKINLRGFDGKVLEGDVFHAEGRPMPKVVTCEGPPDTYIDQRWFLHDKGTDYTEIDRPRGANVKYPDAKETK